MSVNLTRYALWFAGTSLVVLTLVLGIREAFGIMVGSAVVPILPAIIAAMVEGTRYARETRETFPAPWQDAAVMTGGSVAITAVMILATAFTGGGGISTTSLEPILVLMAVYAVFWLITNRIFLAMGARNEWAAQDRRGS